MNLLLQATGFHRPLNGSLYRILIAGIGVDHVPFCCFCHGYLPKLSKAWMTYLAPMSKIQM